jgi:hypothetical protein
MTFIDIDKIKKGYKIRVSYFVFSQKNINNYPDQCGTVIKINKEKKIISKEKINKVINKTSKEKRKVISIVLLNDNNNKITIYNENDCENFGGYTKDCDIYFTRL